LIAKCENWNDAISRDGDLHCDLTESVTVWKTLSPTPRSCIPLDFFHTLTRHDVIGGMKYHTHRFRIAKLRTTADNFIDGTNIKHSLRLDTGVRVCSRCHRLKKKCSEKPPACELCTSGGHVCSLGQLATRQIAPLTTQNNVQDNALSSFSSDSVHQQNGVQLSSSRVLDRDAHSAATASTFDGTYLSYVHAYFRHVHRAYPFLDRQEILSNAKASTYLNIWADNSDSIVSALHPAAYRL